MTPTCDCYKIFVMPGPWRCSDNSFFLRSNLPSLFFIQYLLTSHLPLHLAVNPLLLVYNAMRSIAFTIPHDSTVPMIPNPCSHSETRLQLLFFLVLVVEQFTYSLVFYFRSRVWAHFLLFSYVTSAICSRLTPSLQFSRLVAFRS